MDKKFITQNSHLPILIFECISTMIITFPFRNKDLQDSHTKLYFSLASLGYALGQSGDYSGKTLKSFLLPKQTIGKN